METKPPEKLVGGTLSPTEARDIAKDAYIYGFPIVDGYRIQYTCIVDQKNSEFKAPWNQIANVVRVVTPDDKEVQDPNSDTPYSALGLDLRAAPIVLNLPPIEKQRYFSVHHIDAYTLSWRVSGARRVLLQR
jgi:hypothetical protein